MKYLLIFLLGCTTTQAGAPTKVLNSNEGIITSARKFNNDYEENILCHIPEFVNLTEESITAIEYNMYLGIGRYGCLSRFGMGHPCPYRIEKIEPLPEDYLDATVNYNCAVSIIPEEGI